MHFPYADWKQDYLEESCRRLREDPMPAGNQPADRKLLRQWLARKRAQAKQRK
jgi:hypothetical protein